MYKSVMMIIINKIFYEAQQTQTIILIYQLLRNVV